MFAEGLFGPNLRCGEEVLVPVARVTILGYARMCLCVLCEASLRVIHVLPSCEQDRNLLCVLLNEPSSYHERVCDILLRAGTCASLVTLNPVRVPVCGF